VVLPHLLSVLIQEFVKASLDSLTVLVHLVVFAFEPYPVVEESLHVIHKRLQVLIQPQVQLVSDVFEGDGAFDHLQVLLVLFLSGVLGELEDHALVVVICNPEGIPGNVHPLLDRLLEIFQMGLLLLFEHFQVHGIYEIV